MTETLPPGAEITAEQIIDLFPRTRRDHAERVAAYIDLRAQGETSFGAVQRLRLDADINPARYERWANAVLTALGQPPLPAVTRPTPRPFSRDPFFYTRRGL